MKTKERWQFLISNSILGPVLCGVRRNGRGPWLGGLETDKPIPQYVDLHGDVIEWWAAEFASTELSRQMA